MKENWELIDLDSTKRFAEFDLFKRTKLILYYDGAYEIVGVIHSGQSATFRNCSCEGVRFDKEGGEGNPLILDLGDRTEQMQFKFEKNNWYQLK